MGKQPSKIFKIRLAVSENWVCQYARQSPNNDTQKNINHNYTVHPKNIQKHPKSPKSNHMQ